MADLSVKFCGLKLKNPLIAAAGPITSNEEAVNKLADNGIAAIVTKTGFIKREYEKWIGRKNIFPYKPVYKYQSLINGKLLSLPSLSDVPAEEMAKRLERMKKAGIPVIGSIMGLSVRGYVESAKILENAGADAIEIDLCCTIPEFTAGYKYAGQNVNFYPKIYAKLIREVKKNISVPVGIKSTVSLYLYAKIFEGLIRAKIGNCFPDFITLTGQLDQNPGVDLDSMKPIIPHIPSMGWQGDLSPLVFSALAAFGSVLDSEILPLSASGGIRDWSGLIQSLMLGASTVQLQTAVLDHGPRIISKILNETDNYLTVKGIASISKLIGTVSSEYIPVLILGKFMRERDMMFGKVTAEICAEFCSGCGICENVCTEGAIKRAGKTMTIEKNKCRGCNLCVLKCPEKAVSLTNPEVFDELTDRFKHTGEIDSFRNFMRKKKIGLADILRLPAYLKKWGLL